MSKPQLQADLTSTLRSALPAALPEYLLQRRWFGSKSREIRRVEVTDIVPAGEQFAAFFVLVRVEFVSGPAENYDLPLIVSSGKVPEGAAELHAKADGVDIPLYDALADARFQEFLLAAVEGSRVLPGAAGEARAIATAALKTLRSPGGEKLQPALMRAEQSNTSIAYGKKLIFKLFRRLEEGINPDIEIGLFLTQETGFRNAPPVAGYLEYRDAQGRQTMLGILQQFVVSQGDAWQFTLGALAEYYAKHASAAAPPLPDESLLELAEKEIPEAARQAIGSYLDSASLLGLRTAEMHLSLASAKQDAAFVPEPFSAANLQELADSAVALLEKNLALLRAQQAKLPAPAREMATQILGAREKLVARLKTISSSGISALRTRIHGDYHLGQVLYTGSDFVIIDFEGEPARSLEERRRKRSPLQDVAGMLRSFDYAAHAPLVSEGVQVSPEWAEYWKTWVSAAFLRAYFEKAGGAGFVPKDAAALLDIYVLDKALYELGYELNSRPTWVGIPLAGILGLVNL